MNKTAISNYNSTILFKQLVKSLPALCMLATQAVWAISFQQVNGPFAEAEAWGSSWGDLNNDRCPDLFVNHHRHQAALYKNNCDGTFKDITAMADPGAAWQGGNRYADQHGAAWGDYDNDGDQDLFVTTGARWDGQLMVNEDGVLTNRTAQAGLLNDLEGRMPMWFDYDDDRAMDLFMQSRTRTWSLRQLNDGSFVDSSDTTGLAQVRATNYVHLIDLDNDGSLEYLGMPEGTFPTAAFDLSQIPFRDIRNNIPSVGPSVDSAVADFNGDQRNDILLIRGRIRPAQSKQFGNNVVETWFTPNGGGENQSMRFKSPNGNLTIQMYSFLGLVRYHIGSGGYHPDSSTRINSTSFTFNLNASETRNQGIKPHSSNAPEDLGIYIGYHPSTQEWEFDVSSGGSYTTAYLVVTSSNTVSQLQLTGDASIDNPLSPQMLLNNGQGFAGSEVPFTLTTDIGDLATPVNCVSVAAADFDNDMDPDVYMACSGGVENTANLLYENRGDGKFDLVANAGGAQGPIGSSVTAGHSLSDSVTVADYDGDGRLDMFVSNGVQLFPIRFDSPDQLYRNTTSNSNHWIELDLNGTMSNRDGIGAKIYATAGGVTQLHEKNGAQHRWSQHHQRIHFGLGGNQSVDLRIEWPSGMIDVYNNVSANSLYQITEDGAITPTTLGPVAPDPGTNGGDGGDGGGGGTADIVDVLRAVYSASNDYIWVQATSDLQPLSSALLTVTAITNGFDQVLGTLNWNANNSAYQSTFNGISIAPDCITVTSSGGGSGLMPVEGTGHCDVGDGGDGGGDGGTADNLTVVNAIYFSAENKIWIRASSDAIPEDSSVITATIVTNGVQTELGEVGWKGTQGFYQQNFTGINNAPNTVILNSQLGGMSSAPVRIQ